MKLSKNVEIEKQKKKRFRNQELFRLLSKNPIRATEM